MYRRVITTVAPVWAAIARAAPRSLSPWRLAPVERGEVISEMLGQSLPRTFPVIDKFPEGLATSIKSIDLRAAAYANPARLRSMVHQYIDDVAAFRGAVHAKHTVRAQETGGRALELAVPLNAGTPEQMAVLEELLFYAEERGVTVIIVELP
jgi:filamentous hemagglutinin